MRLAMAMLLTMAAGSAFAATCPDNGISAGCWPDAIGYSSSLSAAQIGPNGVEAWTSGQPCTRGCYDLPAGNVVGVGYVNTQGGCVGGVQTSDVYTIVGPGSAPVALQAYMQFQLTLPAGGHYTAQLYVPGGPSDQATDDPLAELMLPLSIVPGDPFTLHADVEAYGDQSIRPVAPVIANGTILFALPPAYWIVSCRNYNVATPVHTSSWGGVKALYR